MKPSQQNLTDGPLWGWELATFTSDIVFHNVCTTLSYDEDFPVSEVTAGFLTLPSRENFNIDMMLDRLPLEYPKWWTLKVSTVLLASWSDEAIRFVGDAFEPDGSLNLGITHVINLPHEARVACVLELMPSESVKAVVSSSTLQQHAKAAQQSQEAWEHASQILKHSSHEKQWNNFQYFLSSYPEVVDNPKHPVNVIRRDLEDAVLSNGNKMRHSLTCRRPTPPVRDFLDWMPVGLVVEQEETPDVHVLKRYTCRGLNIRPPRDGAFHTIRLGVPGETTRWIVFWHPHREEPPFLVVKAAACTIVPSILRLPLNDVIAQPVSDLGRSNSPLSDENTTSVSEIHPLWGLDYADRFRIAELRPTSSDPEAWAKAGDAVRHDIRERGTEALAWHQGFHEHTDNAWGIVFNAMQIDRFVQGVYTAVTKATAGYPPNYGFIAMAVVKWIAEHEWFHARVEAALTQLEITSGVPRRATYRTNVYEKLACVSDNCLEEALANYTAQKCLRDGGNTWAALLSQQEQEALAVALEAEMMLSPPGYRAWERGRDVHSWRSLAWELVSGQTVAHAKEPLPPLETLLLGPLPYDQHKGDIAWYVYGEGVVTNALLASPSMLAVPARRELTKALRHLGYKCVESRGKGSHEMWFKDDGAGFSLPRRDPVGRKVFGAFLAHSGVETKARYIKEVRPNI